MSKEPTRKRQRRMATSSLEDSTVVQHPSDSSLPLFATTRQTRPFPASHILATTVPSTSTTAKVPPILVNFLRSLGKNLPDEDALVQRLTESSLSTEVTANTTATKTRSTDPTATAEGAIATTV